MKQGIIWAALFVAVATIAAAVAAHACAVCLNGAGGERLTDAFNWSVLFLMAMPYTVLVSIAGFLFYTHRRAVRKARGDIARAPILCLVWIHKESGR